MLYIIYQFYSPNRNKKKQDKGVNWIGASFYRPQYMNSGTGDAI